MLKLSRLAAALVTLQLPLLAFAAAPQYTVTDLGTLAVGGNAASAWGMSSSGNFITGTTLNYPQASTSQTAFVWQASTGMTALSQLSGHGYEWGYGVNNVGTTVGVAATNGLGSNPLPVVWNSSGAVTQLALPVGETAGRARDINDNGIAVGSVGSGISEKATIFNTMTGKTTVISTPAADGSVMMTAFGVNNAGLVIGTGADANGVSVAMVYDMTRDTMIRLNTGTGAASAFGLSENGIVSGSAANNSTSFTWSQASGMSLVPFASSVGTAGSIYSINNAGLGVGTGSGRYANPFLYADGSEYLLADLLVNPGSWNMSTTTSTRAMGIGDNGTITGWAMVGTGVHAFVMTPVPEPATYGLMALGLAVTGVAVRRRTASAAA